MALMLLASAWYIALVTVAAALAVHAHRRRHAERAALDAVMTYEERRDHDRAEHLARVRQEELAELRRRERHVSHA